MTPETSLNLDRFLAQFATVGTYRLAVGHIDELHELEPFFEMAIGKSDLRVVPAWQIDLNDPDIAAIHETDEPVIPQDVPEVPFNRVVEWKRQRRSPTRR